MATKLDTASHHVYKQILGKGEPRGEDFAYCGECGCEGNMRCGHRPLAEPEHLCELDINDEGESGRCYCCRAVECDNAKEDNG